MKGNTAIIQGDRVLMRFIYHEDLIYEIKNSFRFREWNGFTKTWEIRITDRYEKENLENILQEYNFEVNIEEELFFNELAFSQNNTLILYYIDLNRMTEEEKKNLRKAFLKENTRYRYYEFTCTKSLLETCLNLIERKEIIVQEKVKNELFKIYHTIIEEIEKSQRIEAQIEIPELTKALFPFQKAGVLYLIEKKRALLADEMGLGKTIQAIAAVIYQKAFPCLVVCPATLKWNWQREIISSTNNQYSVYVVDNRKNGKNGVNINQADFVIINYDILAKYLDQLRRRNFQVLIVDESHYIKNPKAQRTKAVLEMAKDIQKKNGAIYLLTGTPILNRPIELLSQLKTLGVFNQIAKNDWEYLKRYCGAYQDFYGWTFNGATNIQELQEKLRITCMIRREKKDVLTELPDKLRNILSIRINDSHYFELEEEYEEAEAEEKLGYIPRLYTASGVAKIPYILDWVENFYNNFDKTKKLVIFAYHIEVQNTLYSELMKKEYKVLKLTADMDSATRHHAVQQFQEDPSIQIIVVSLRAGGEGITLTAADTALFAEPYWVPAILIQAEDRLHRISQKSSVNIYYMIATNTIDSAIWSIAEEKERLFKELTSGIELTEKQKKMKEVIKNVFTATKKEQTS